MAQHNRNQYAHKRPYKPHPYRKQPYKGQSHQSYKRKQKPAEPQEVLTITGLIVVVALVWAYQNAAVNQTAQQVLALLAAALLLVGFGFVFYMLRMQQKRRALRALCWANVDIMGGFDFEQYVGAVMSSLGYEVQFTAASGDFGVDILARKNGERIAVQIKRSRNFIGLGAVQEVVAGMYHYKCDRSMVVTNSTFSDAAKTLAASNNCQLIDRSSFGQWIVAFQKGGKR